MFSKETRIAILKSRMALLNARDPGGNTKLVKKIQRRLRIMEG